MKRLDVKKLGFFFLLSSFVLIVTVILLEIIFTFASPVANRQSNSHRYIYLHETPPGTTVTASKDYYYNNIYGVSNVYNGLGEYHAVIDENGFVFPSQIHELPNKTLLFLGGSTTECITVSEDLRYPYLTGRMLEKATGLRYNSYNAGVGAGNSQHSINTLINKGLALNPNIAILHHNINDLLFLLYSGRYWGTYVQSDTSVRESSTPFFITYAANEMTPQSDDSITTRVKNTAHSIFPELYARFRLLRFPNMGDSARNSQTQKQKPTEQINLKNQEALAEQITGTFAGNLNLFISICRINHIEPVLMTQASRITEQPDQLISLLYNAGGTPYPEMDYETFYFLYSAMNETIRRVAAENEILCIDLASTVPKEDAFFYDMVHYTDVGSELAADIISRELLDSGLLE